MTTPNPLLLDLWLRGEFGYHGGIIRETASHLRRISEKAHELDLIEKPFGDLYASAGHLCEVGKLPSPESVRSPALYTAAQTMANIALSEEHVNPSAHMITAVLDALQAPERQLLLQKQPKQQQAHQDLSDLNTFAPDRTTFPSLELFVVSYAAALRQYYAEHNFSPK